MWFTGQRLVLALAISGAAATLTLAALPPPYDFTGQWSGTATSRSGDLSLSADFAPTPSPRKFTGNATLEDGLGNHITCTLTAKYTRKLTLHLRCDTGGKQTLAVRFDTATQTLAGSFLVGHRHPHVARFTLTRTPT